MPTYYAQAAGAIQSVVWDTAPTGGGSTLTWPPGVGDVLVANGKALIWQAAAVPSLTCTRLTTRAEAGTAGGTFALSGNTAVSITAAIEGGGDHCVTSTHTGTGASRVTLTGDVTGGTVNFKSGWLQNAVGTLHVDGDCAGGTANAPGLNIFAAATVTVTGDALGTGAGGLDAAGILQTQASSSVTLTGNITAGTAKGYILVAGALTVYGGAVTGGSAANCFGLDRRGTGAVTINGNVVGGGNLTAFGVYGMTTGSGPITVIGSLVDSATCSAAAGKVYWQPASVAHYWQVAWNGSYNFRYTLPPVAPNVREGVQRGYMLESPDNGTLRIPAEADVKLGVGYGGGGTEYTGTLVAGGGGVPLIGPGGLVG